MPVQTPYGYSGMNAMKANSKSKIAMYAAGGFAAGAVAGVGSYYLYNSMYGSQLSYFRRRRAGPVSWCIVPDGPDKGSIMECQDCYKEHGLDCPSTQSCFGSEGCSYSLPRSFNRDDMMQTGFLPANFQPPLKVKFQSIAGEDITRAEVCPPRTEIEFAARGGSAMSFRADIFLTLTELDSLGDGSEAIVPGIATPSPGACKTSTEYECKAMAQAGMEGLSACYDEDEVCKATDDGLLECFCKPGFCLEGSGQEAVCNPLSGTVSQARGFSTPGVISAMLLCSFRLWLRHQRSH